MATGLRNRKTGVQSEVAEAYPITPGMTFKTFHPKKQRLKIQAVSGTNLHKGGGYFTETESAACISNEQQPLQSPSGAEPSLKQQAGRGSVISYIISSRSKLGLSTEPSHHPYTSERERVLLSLGPIAGVKDLKALSQRLQSCKESQAVTDLDAESDPNHFVYCLRRDDLHPKEKEDWDPYALEIVGAERARACQKYYTVSAFTVVLVEQGGGMEVTAVQQWMWERDIFYKVHSFPFFKHYKQWKAFIIWKKWVKRKKVTSCRSSVQASLFSSDILLQQTLLHVRSLCLPVTATSRGAAKGRSTLSLLDLTLGDTVSLDQFMASQRAAVVRVKESLRALREEIVTTVLACCKSVVDYEGVLGLEGQTNSNEEPSHIQVLEWRAILKRLQRFVQVCQQLSLTLLQSIIMEAVTSLQNRITGVSRAATEKSQIFKDQLQKMLKETVSQPFSSNITDRFMREDEEEWEGLHELSFHSVPFSSFLPPVQELERSPTQFYAFLPNPLADHKEDIPLSDGIAAPLLKITAVTEAPLWKVQLELMESSVKPVAHTEENGCPSSSANKHYVMSLNPSQEEFSSAIDELFSLYHSVVSSFTSLLNDEHVLPYVGHSRYDLLMQLEEPDEDRSKAPSWPHIQLLLSEYRPYQSSVEYIRRAVEVTMKEAEKMTIWYKCFCDMVDCCSRMDVGKFLKKKEWSAAIFQRTFAYYRDQVHAMGSMVEGLSVGVVWVEAVRFQQDCLSHPLAILKELGEQLPRLSNAKSNHVIKAIKASNDDLQSTPCDVEGFVQYLDHVEEASTLIPQLEAEILVTTNLYTVAQEFDVAVPAEEMAVYRALFPQLRHLKSLLLQAEATKSEYVHDFMAMLRSQIVTLLGQATELKANIEDPVMLQKNTPDRALEVLGDYKKELDDLQSQANICVQYYQRFSAVQTTKRRYYSMDPSSHSWTPEEVYEEVSSVQKSLGVRQILFSTWRDWSKFTGKWKQVSLGEIDINELKKEVKIFLHTVDYLESSLPVNQVVKTLREEIVSFHSHLPTLSCLLNPFLKLRHWDIIEQCTGHRIDRGRGSMTISVLQQLKIFDHHSMIASVSDQASNEATLKTMLKKVTQEWVGWEFILVPYKESSGRQTHILGGVDDIMASLDDSLATLTTIRSSKHVTPIKHAVLDWESRLSLLLEVVEHWVVCQRKWLYLETVFSAVDIQRQLTGEVRLFQQADKSLREAVQIILDKPTALKAATTPGVLEAFQVCSAFLEQVFKNLEDYLEAKRLSFSRFYFISNNEILDILAHVKTPHKIQPYLSKLFSGITRLELASESSVSPSITAMISTEGEKVLFPKGLVARGNPDQWLGGVEKAMMITIKKLMKEGHSSYVYSQSSLKEMIVNHAGQVVLTTSKVDWTQRVEACLQNAATLSKLKALLDVWVTHLEELAVLSSVGGVSVPQLQTLTALLTLQVHERDVIQMLVEKKVDSGNDFEWIRQLRYYWDHESGSCWLNQCFSHFPYGYEYLGCQSRLVLTPLSERCYLTLTTALHLHLGGSPIGPAGTGKSETIKDLAKAMGKLCLVFNCSDGLDYKMMGRFFSGMCQSGVWCCFDEFNRINIEVLSVIAQHLQNIKTAKDQGNSKVMFDGKEVNLVLTCAVFITMNPSYADRVELPDNVQSFFRPVAMMIPDTTKIAEVLLFTHGFTSAISLAAKLSKFYEAASLQLSSQVHYDFGLRSVKTVIILAGIYLRDIKRTNSSVPTKSSEQTLLLKALKETTFPKLVSEDLHLVTMLLQDLFPGISCSNTNHMEILESYITTSTTKTPLQHVSTQVDKCLQLYNTMQVRHGVMLLGPTGGGKSTIINLLQTSLSIAHEEYYCPTSTEEVSGLPAMPLNKMMGFPSAHVVVKVVNPKCYSTEELYGHFNPINLEWSTGVASKILQEFSQSIQSNLDSSKTKDDWLRRTYQSTQCLTHDHSESSSYHDSEQEAKSWDLGGKTFTSSLQLPNDNLPVTKGMPYPICAPAGWRWLVFDGPVDSSWIENLNSTLDDSQILCLANGERVQLCPGMRVLFETDELSNASPATVSRCGMIYVDSTDLGWRPYVISWMNTLPDSLPNKGKTHLLSLFDQSIDSGVVFLRQYGSKLSCAVPTICAVSTLCGILEALLHYISTNCGGFSAEIERLPADQAMDCSADQQSQVLRGFLAPTKHLSVSSKKLNKHCTSSKAEQLPFLHQHPERFFELLSKMYVFAFVWAFGSCLQPSSEDEQESVFTSTDILCQGGSSTRRKFNALIHKTFSNPSAVVVGLPLSADLFSYYLDLNTCSFVPWKKLVPSAKEISTRVAIMQKSIASSLQSWSISSFVDVSSPIGQIQDASRMGLVPTLDLVRLSFFVSLLISRGHHVLISGKVGAGKSLLLKYLQEILESMEKTRNIISEVLGGRFKSNISSTKQPSSTEQCDSSATSTYFHVSSQTSVALLQSHIEKSVTKKRNSTLLIPKMLLLCLDDLNCAPVDSHNSQPCSELLREMIDRRGWYDCKSLKWKNIEGVNVIGSIGERSWCCHALNERCVSRYSLFGLPEPSRSTLSHIYSTHLIKSFSSTKYPQLVDQLSRVVDSAIFIYLETKSTLLPSPSRPQYTFSTRDLSKVFTGFLRIKQKNLQNESDVINLLCHEVQRVFYDRCALQDRFRVLEILSEALRIHFKVLRSPEKLGEEVKEQAYLHEGFTERSQGYSVVKSTKKLVKQLERLQSLYNIAENKDSQLLFFPMACEHIVRIARVLQQPAGHLLLLGMGGVGRRSSVQLASYITGCKFYYLSLLYKTIQCKYQETMKEILIQCGVKNQSCVFLIADSLGEQECLFHDLHELVINGKVARLFDREEADEILLQLAEGTIESSSSAKQHLWNTFVMRVRMNLHVAMCFPPSSPTLTSITRKFPGLVHCATVNMFVDWPSKALYGVALRELHTSAVAEKGALKKDTVSSLATAFVHIHSGMVLASQKAQEEYGHCFPVTPFTFIYCVKLFCCDFLQQSEELSHNKLHLEQGLHQLCEADKRAATMNQELEQLQPQLLKKTKEVESLLKQLSCEQQEIDELRASVELEREEIVKENEQMAALAKESEAELLQVLPALERAEKGLTDIKISDLLEIRSYTSPPAMVTHVMGSLCVLLDEPTDWDSVKHLTKEPTSFLKRLTAYDKNNMPNKVLQKLKKYSNDPSFNPESVAHYSVACKSFCRWILAIEHYAKVYHKVQPKREHYQQLALKLQAVEVRLETKEEQLEELQSQVNGVREKYSCAVNERNELQRKCEVIAVLLQRAEILMQSLKDEQIRWSETIENLSSQMENLVGNSLLRACILVYSGPLVSSYRHSQLSRWKRICLECKLLIDPNFSCEITMADTEQVHEWRAWGLSNDAYSLQNAVLVMQSKRRPLIIDPEGQATRWLKEMLKNSGLMVLSMKSPQLLKHLEQAARIGLPVLIEDVGNDAISRLEPFLATQISNQEKTVLTIGKTEIDCSTSFKLFLVCKQSHLSQSSVVCMKTSVVNFSTSFEGLQDWLLSLTMSLEEPVLESQYSKLQLSISADQKELKLLEHSLLGILRNSHGNILDDLELIKALQEVKQVSVEVKERLARAHETGKTIAAKRSLYVPVANRGAILYLCAQKLQQLCPVYHYSLEWLQSVFSMCVHKSQVSANFNAVNTQPVNTQPVNTQQHISALVSSITEAVHKGIAMALSSDHHLPFTFTLCCNILLHKNVSLGFEPDLTQIEWDTFVSHQSGAVPQHQSHMIPVPPTSSNPTQSRGRGSGRYRPLTSQIQKFSKPHFLSKQAWDFCIELERVIPSLKRLTDHVSKNKEMWKSFTSSSEPCLFKFENDLPPIRLSMDINESSCMTQETSEFSPDSLTPFQRLLLIKALCPHHLASSVEMFICTNLGKEYTRKPVFDLESILQETSNSTPILFILGPGTDPTGLLEQLSVKSGSMLYSISLGQGQGERVTQLVEQGIQRGYWILLQNCHLAPSWMSQLDEIIRSINNSEVHSSFKLWLSSNRKTTLPSSVLQKCAKVSLEPSSSLVASMQQLLSTNGTAIFTKSVYEDAGTLPMWKQLLFQLCFFHVSINGRSLYGTAGWSVPYRFTTSDIKVSVHLVKELLMMNTAFTPWEAVHCLIGDICYGGRVTEPHDLICLKAIWERCFSHEVAFKGDHKTNQIFPEVCHLPPFIPIINPSTSYTECSTMIEELPWDYPPEVLGIHQSSQFELKCIKSKELQSMLRTVALPISTQDFKMIQFQSNDKLVLEKASDMLSQLPPSLELPPSVKVQQDPLAILLTHEVKWWEKQLAMVSYSLHQLLSAINGEVAMLEEIDDVYSSLLRDAVPKAWMDVHDPKKDSVCHLSQWFKRLLEDYKCLSHWVALNTKDCKKFMLPQTLRLSALSRTSAQGLFAALIHKYSNTMRVPLEDVEIHFEVLTSPNTMQNEPSIGVVLTGIALVGAMWCKDEGIVELREAGHKGNTCKYNPLPDVWCQARGKPMDRAHYNVNKSGNTYLCPFYFSLSHTYLATLPLPSSTHPLYWTLRGVQACST